MFEPTKPRACKTVDEINVGDEVVLDYSISYEEVALFSKICGDFNPVHHDPEFAEKTIFGKQIAHGMISVSKFSGIFGMDSPGLGAIYLNQTVQFAKPVYLDHPYQAIARVKEVNVDKNLITYETYCINAETHEEVMRGEAQLKAIPAKVREKLETDAV